MRVIEQINYRRHEHPIVLVSTVTSQSLKKAEVYQLISDLQRAIERVEDFFYQIACSCVNKKKCIEKIKYTEASSRLQDRWGAIVMQLLMHSETNLFIKLGSG